MAAAFRLIADSLAAGLQLATLPIAASVTRANWIEIDASDMAAPMVVVTPGNVEGSRASRQITQLDYSINVFVGMHCNNDSDVDAVMDLADHVYLLVRAHSWGEVVAFPEGVTSPLSATIEINPDDGLSERNIWRAMIVATYRVFEADALP